MTGPTPPRCDRCRAPGTFFKVQGSSGWKVTCRCVPCGGLFGLPVASRQRAWFPVVLFALDLLPMLKSTSNEPDQCEVCGDTSTLTELHHSAPRSLFGAEADLWPIVALCRPCHERWHRLTGCPIGRRP